MRRVSTWEGPVEVDHSPNGALVFYLPPRSHGKGGAFSPGEARQIGEALTDEARAAERASNTQKVRRMAVKENQSGISPWWFVGGIGVVAAIFLATRSGSASTAAPTTTTTPGTAPGSTTCSVTNNMLVKYGAEHGITVNPMNKPVSQWDRISAPNTKNFSTIDCAFYKLSNNAWVVDQATMNDFVKWANDKGVGLSGVSDALAFAHPADIFLAF